MNEEERNRIIVEHFRRNPPAPRAPRLVDLLLPVEPMPPASDHHFLNWPEGAAVVEDEWDDGPEGV